MHQICIQRGETSLSIHRELNGKRGGGGCYGLDTVVIFRHEREKMSTFSIKIIDFFQLLEATDKSLIKSNIER